MQCHSIYTLMRLFGEPALESVVVEGDLQITMTEGYRTRSKTRGRSDERNWEPFQMRVFKLLVREHIVEIENIKKPIEFGSESEEEVWTSIAHFEVSHSQET